MAAKNRKEVVWTTVNDDALKFAAPSAAFLEREFRVPGGDPTWSEEYFRWKLGAANPAGRGYLSLAMVEDRIVGTVSLTRKRVMIDGREFRGGEVGDSYSSVSIRRAGRPAVLSPWDDDPDSFLNRSVFGRLAAETRARATAEGVAIIYGTPNRNAYSSWTKRLDYFDLNACNLRVFVRPTARFIATHPRLRPFRTGFALAEKTFNRLSRLPSAGVAWEAGFPDRDQLDALWRRLQPTRGFSLVRDSAYWQHRYVDHPLARYDFLAMRVRGQLGGVVVTRLFSTANGRRCVAIVEWLKDERVSVGQILREIVHTYRQAEVELFTFYAIDSLPEIRAIKWNLFFRRARVPVIFAATTEAQEFREHYTGMDFYLGSSDAV